MGKLAFYMHGGSENHGCEAIVRSTINMIKENVTLYSRYPDMDYKYGVNNICEIKNRTCKPMKRYSLLWWKFQFKKRILKDSLCFVKYNYSQVIDDAKEGDLYFSIGGDNYCGELVPALKYVNQSINKKGAKTVLWGCSIDPKFIQEKENQEDLKRYTLIIAREKMTYNALVDAGLENIVRYYPDPAFTLEKEEWELPEEFNFEVIGLNISPYVQKNGEGNKVYENYREVIKYILKNTNAYIALIPHVIWKESDDRIYLDKLYEEFSDTHRIVYIEDQNCMRLKYCISKCSMLITARTHASIAAYSTCVPTLVVGYSMKSKGIAEDIFGTTENYVVNAWDMQNENVLLQSFKWQYEHKEEIRKYLENIMPEYVEKAYHAKEEIKEIIN